MENQFFVKMAPTLPKDNEEKIVIITPNNGGLGKILVREDTIIGNIQGCATCGRGQFTCSGVKNQWSALCWGKQSEKKYYTLLVIFFATFVLSLIGTIFFCFTNTINDVVLSSMVIRNNSLAYSIWQHPNVKPLMKVRLFNYTNWQNVRDRYEERLHVEEVGPYVYSQELERVNVNFEDDRLTFQELNHFKYIPEKSVGAEFDQVYVPNLPLLGVIAKTIGANANTLVQLSLSSALQWTDHPNAFVKLPVHRFLWGYDDSIISAAKPFLSLAGQWKFDKFGLLASKNGTLSEKFTINTGENDKDRMNMIEKVDGNDHLPYWSSSDCNSLESSDGSIFPPSMLDRRQPLYVFYPQLCRRLPFVYEKDVEISDGIHLLRYRMPDNVFDDPSTNPANECYCEIDTGTCPPRGVINVTDCTMGAPALVSFPHFHLGDERLREKVTGLHPDPLIHNSFVDFHPTLGIALNGKSSLQINIQVRKSSFFSALRYLEDDLILPVAWIEVGIEELPESLQSLVYHGTYSTAAVQLGLSVFCIIALVVSGICLVLMFERKKHNVCATVKKISVGTDLKGPVQPVNNVSNAEPISNNKQPVETVSNNKQPVESVSNNKQPVKPVSNNKQTVETVTNNKQLVETVPNNKQPVKTVTNNKQPVETVSNNKHTIETVKNNIQPVETVTNKQTVVNNKQPIEIVSNNK